jgi:hypothetical protein
VNYTSHVGGRGVVTGQKWLAIFQILGLEPDTVDVMNLQRSLM